MSDFNFTTDSVFTFSEKDHCYTVEGRPVPSVTQIIKDAGFCDLSHIPPAILERAANFGKAVHDACEAYDLNMLKLPDVAFDILEMVRTWNELKKIIFDLKTPSSIAIEQMIFNKKNWYACRPDRIYDIRDTRHYIVLVDLKTGVYDEKYCGLQLAGYAEAIRSVLGPVAIDSWIACLKDGSLKHVKWAEYSTYFFSALNLFNLKRR